MRDLLIRADRILGAYLMAAERGRFYPPTSHTAIAARDLLADLRTAYTDGTYSLPDRPACAECTELGCWTDDLTGIACDALTSPAAGPVEGRS